MLGMIEYPWWVEPLLLLVLVSPLVLSALVYFHGKKLGKYRKPVAIVILLLGYGLIMVGW
jgi:hypothetical protein